MKYLYKYEYLSEYVYESLWDFGDGESVKEGLKVSKWKVIGEREGYYELGHYSRKSIYHLPYYLLENEDTGETEKIHPREINYFNDSSFIMWSDKESLEHFKELLIGYYEIKIEDSHKKIKVYQKEIENIKEVREAKDDTRK